MKQATMRDPIHEAFAEHRKVLAERDELVAALQAALAASNPAPDHYADTREWVNKARAILAKVQA